MSQSFRTAAGGRIRRDRPIAFRFDGRRLLGCEGDTLASALLANGVHLVGRSFKYHRPRGILSAGAEEPNALVTLERGDGRVTPNLRATQIELYDGLQARSQNRFPSLSLDFGALAGLASPLLGAGFYYKTFMWPPRLWARLYEPAIRAAAGLGRAPTRADPDRYLHRYAHCDVLVVGSGPAGLAAALTASAAGARVMLCDEQAELGGSLLAETAMQIDGVSAEHWLADALETLASNEVTLLPRTTAFGWFPDTLIGLAERVTDHLAQPDPRLPRERLWQVRAREVVLATGAIERPLVFPHNDRPGVMLADSARQYLLRYGVKPGTRAVLATMDDSAYAAALALHDAGVRIAAIADRRREVGGPLQEMARAAGIPIRTSCRVLQASGRMRVRDVHLSGPRGRVACDTLLVSGGWTPSVHLYSQSRGRLHFEPVIGAFVPGEVMPNQRSAGACAGMFDLSGCLQAGYAAGEVAARAAGFGVAARSIQAMAPRVLGAAGHDASRSPHAPPAPGRLSPGEAEEADRPPPPHPKAFVDLQNDVTTKDLAIATHEGFRSIEHVKRYTTAGMATDQGKTANVNALATVAQLLGAPVEAVGHTTFRMPYTPVTFGTLAGAARGDLLEPLRTPPLHHWAAANGALFEDVGSWRRARCFPRTGETPAQAVARECRTVRSAVGMLDASTLGKIEVVGPDAAAFLDRMYTGTMSSLAPGRCRYGLLLRETGFVFDDGVVARLGPHRFHLTTTSGGAGAVLHHLEDYRQTEFTDLRVWLTSTTEHWATIALHGPQARAVLAVLVPELDLDLPPMRVREIQLGEIPCRLFTVSFSGEPGFELNVPADDAETVWQALLYAGAPFGIAAYGTDAMHVLRAEMGYVIVGQETDGTVTPDDLGLGWAVSRGKPDFVGKRSLMLPDMLRPDRRQLVGLLTQSPALVLQEGAQVLTTPNARPPVHSLGHVTSAYWSETLGRSIALALVESGHGRFGETLHVPTQGGTIAVTVVRPVFHQPKPPPVIATPAAVEGGWAADQASSGTSANGAAPDAGHEARSRAEGRQAAPAPALPHQTGRHAGGTMPGLASLPPFTRVVVRAETPAAAAIGAGMGIVLSSAPCRSTTGDDRAALWLGPDEWLVFAPPQQIDLAARVQSGVGDAAGSVVDVSSRSVSLQLDGPHAATWLNSFCALDLAAAAFPVGMCTRTLLGKAEIVLWRTDTNAFHLEVARSYASYVRQCLEQAALEFHIDPGPS